jgi:hypothetical protein
MVGRVTSQSEAAPLLLWSWRVAYTDINEHGTFQVACPTINNVPLFRLQVLNDAIWWMFFLDLTLTVHKFLVPQKPWRILTVQVIWPLATLRDENSILFNTVHCRSSNHTTFRPTKCAVLISDILYYNSTITLHVSIPHGTIIRNWYQSNISQNKTINIYIYIHIHTDIYTY